MKYFLGDVLVVTFVATLAFIIYLAGIVDGREDTMKEAVAHDYATYDIQTEEFKWK